MNSIKLIERETETVTETERDLLVSDTKQKIGPTFSIVLGFFFRDCRGPASIRLSFFQSVGVGI